MEEGASRTSRISNKAATVLLLAAILADILSLIPLVGTIVGPAFWVIANIYFWKSGLGFANSKRLATGAVSVTAEIIPAIQALPTITLGILAIILMSKFEDVTGISASSVGGGQKVGSATGSGGPLNRGGMRQPTRTSQPLNQGGVRAPYGGLGSSK